MTIRWASSRVAASRSEVWTRRAVWTPRTRGAEASCVCTLPVYQRSPSVSLLLGVGRARTRPVQAHRLAGPDLGDLVDVLVGQHADHRIATGHRVIRPEDDRKAV